MFNGSAKPEDKTQPIKCILVGAREPVTNTKMLRSVHVSLILPVIVSSFSAALMHGHHGAMLKFSPSLI